MKKIISLLLVALLLLPVLPAMAAPSIESVIAYNNSDGQALVTFNVDSAFESAEIHIKDNEGNYLTTAETACIIAGGDAGQYTKAIDLSALTFVEEGETFFGGEYTVELKVDGSAVATKDIYINDNNTIVVENRMVAKESTPSPDSSAKLSKYEDTRTSIITWTTNDVYAAPGFRIGDSGLNETFTIGSVNTLEYEMMFENLDENDEVIPGPGVAHNMSGSIYLRQTGGASVIAPYDKTKLSTETTIENAFNPFSSCVTNTWYKIKMVFDMVDLIESNGRKLADTKVYFYMAKKASDGEEYGDYKLVKTISNIALSNLANWRYDCAAKNGPGRITFKNYTLIKETPKVFWKYDGVNTKFADSKTLELSFSADLGELTDKEVVVKNRLGQDVKIDSIVKDEINPKKYVVKFNTNVLSRTDYDVYLKYAERYNSYQAVIPEEDAVNGFWKLDTLTAPANTLNVHTATGNDSAVNVAFNVPETYDFTNKFAAVCWYKNHNVGAANQSESLLGFDIKCLETSIPSNHVDVVFAPATTISADKAKTYIFEIDAATGKATILDFVDVEFTVAPLE